MLKVILATAVLFGSFAFAEGDKKEEMTPAPTEQTAPKAPAAKKAAHGKHMDKKEKTATDKKSE